MCLDLERIRNFKEKAFELYEKKEPTGGKRTSECVVDGKTTKHTQKSS